jgi:uncharacterized SAM-binding protein YcdF (DUF218 family)
LALLWIKQLVKMLVLPPAGPLIVALTGVVISRWRPKLGGMVTMGSVVALTLLAMPAVAGWLVRCLDSTPPLDVAQAANAQAIVVLGGGLRHYAPEYGGRTLGTLTLERVRYCARLARETGLPVLVSGGTTDHGPTEALLMRRVLEQEFGVPVRWSESRSQNTHENALRSAEILHAAGVARAILIGHSFDFPRSRREFEAAGIAVISAPIGMTPAIATAVGDYLPSVSGLRESYYATYEILANALYLITHALERPAQIRPGTARGSTAPP